MTILLSCARSGAPSWPCENPGLEGLESVAISPIDIMSLPPPEVGWYATFGNSGVEGFFALDQTPQQEVTKDSQEDNVFLVQHHEQEMMPTTSIMKILRMNTWNSEN